MLFLRRTCKGGGEEEEEDGEEEEEEEEDGELSAYQTPSAPCGHGDTAGDATSADRAVARVFGPEVSLRRHARQARALVASHCRRAKLFRCLPVPCISSNDPSSCLGLHQVEGLFADQDGTNFLVRRDDGSVFENYEIKSVNTEQRQYQVGPAHGGLDGGLVWVDIGEVGLGLVFFYLMRLGPGEDADEIMQSERLGTGVRCLLRQQWASSSGLPSGAFT